jgi:hypothetical protein
MKDSQSDSAKLAELHRLADEAFREIDEGRGIVLNDAEELREWISLIGRRASAGLKHQRERRTDALDDRE